MRKGSARALSSALLVLIPAILFADPNWIPKAPPTSPPVRWASAAVYDEARHEIVLFGGRASFDPGIELGDTWVWDGTTWAQKLPAVSPPPRDSHMMVYDAVRQEVVLFGGWGGGFLNDTWVWDGMTWTQKFSSNPPSPRAAFALSFDASRQEAVLFGGYQGSYVFLGDTWTWDGATWTQKFPATSPPALNSSTMVYDAGRQENVLFGGSYSYFASSIVDETWMWNGTTWTRAQPAVRPPARDTHPMTYDAARQEVVVFGGEGIYSLLADSWTWNGVAWSQITMATNPPALRLPAMAYDSNRGETVLFGGWDGSNVLGDTWVLSWNQAPVANAGPDLMVACTGAAGTAVVLDGSRSADPDGDTLTYTWTGPFPEGDGRVTGVNPTVTLPLGTSKVTLVVSDGSVDSAQATVNVTVSLSVQGFLPPLAGLVPEGQAVQLPDKALKQGRTVPMKLELSCGENACLADLQSPRIAKLVRSGEELDLDTLDLDAGSANDGGLAFRQADCHWIYNLSTKGLSPGTYIITIEMPDGVRYDGGFVLRM